MRAFKEGEDVGIEAAVGVVGQSCAEAEQAGRKSGGIGHAALFAFDDDAGQAGLERALGHAFAERAEAAIGVGGDEAVEQSFGGLDSGVGRGVEPGEFVEVADAHGLEGEGEAAEVVTLDLGKVAGGAADEVVLWVEADDAAGCGAGAASGALGGGRLADALDL